MTRRTPLHRLSRRTLLKAGGTVAGATLFAPFMRQVAHAQTAAPKRFVFVVEGNCFEPVTMLSPAARALLDANNRNPVGSSRWWHREYQHTGSPLQVPHGDLGAAPALAPFLSSDQDVDLSTQAAVVMGLSSKITGGGHSTAHGALSSSRSSPAAPAAQTIDAYLAALPQVRADTPFDALRLGVSPDANAPLDYGTCAYARDKPAALILQPSAAFNALFGSVASTEGQATFARRSALLDFAVGDVQAALTTFSGNSRERQKLERYIQSLEEVQARQQRLLQMEADNNQLSSSMPTLPAANPLYQSGQPLDTFRAHLELVAAAFLGDLTHVAVVGSGTGGNFGLTYSSVHAVGRHDLHHQSAGVPEYLAAIHEVTRQQVAAVAQLASTLAATPEVGGDGSMLDHTAIVFVSDNGEQHHSTASDWPVLLVGGSALGLQTGGRSIIYPGLDHDGHRQVSNLWNTLGHCAGDDLNTFGLEGPGRLAEGPLSELYAG